MSDTPERNDDTASRGNARLLKIGTASVEPLLEALNDALETIDALKANADPELANTLLALEQSIDRFEPSVTLLGQVKAGKTALANVMSGHVDLLPSDVNPWTSVVTTLHLNAIADDQKTRAEFTFFDAGEWEQLVTGGGRLGELADRAGADDELETIQKQIEEMQENARARLSTKFEALLGKCHKYGYCDRELIERYVCLGDPDELAEDPGNKQGRFADITKSAELFLDVPDLGVPLCLRDTPGVNDTFMVREQITIRALRGSEICVVVLSANEALNTTDLALVRLISNFEDRQVILFVNRIDELAKPSEQVPEIRESILETLSANGAGKDATLIFGSARWGEIALTGELERLDEEDQRVLFDWAEAGETGHSQKPEEYIWSLSGMPDLRDAINRRILEGSGQRLVERVNGTLSNFKNHERAKAAITEAAGRSKLPRPIDLDAVTRRLDAITSEYTEALDLVIEEHASALRPRLEKVQNSYVQRATDALVTHIQSYGEQDVWTFSSTGLRMVLRSTYVRFAGAITDEVGAVYEAAADDCERVFTELLGVQLADFAVVPPKPPRIPPPVMLGKTIALDLGSNWWRRWWKSRRGVASYAEDYSRLIQAEVGSIIQDLEANQLQDVFEEMRRLLADFLGDQRRAAMLATKDLISPEPVDDVPQGERIGTPPLVLENLDETTERTAL